VSNKGHLVTTTTTPLPFLFYSITNLPDHDLAIFILYYYFFSKFLVPRPLSSIFFQLEFIFCIFFFFLHRYDEFHQPTNDHSMCLFCYYFYFSIFVLSFFQRCFKQNNTSKGCLTLVSLFVWLFLHKQCFFFLLVLRKIAQKKKI